MAVQKQDDQHEHAFSNYVRIRDVVQKTCLRRWTIGKSGERGSGISVLPARHDDDDDDDDDDDKQLICFYTVEWIEVLQFFSFTVKHVVVLLPITDSFIWKQRNDSNH